MKSLGIMQAYFMPYIGYFQLINAVDEFVIYDNIQYTKKGWINRNRILQGESDQYITLPLKKASDYLNIDERFLSETFDRNKLVRQIKTAYHKAPYYLEVSEWLQGIISYEEDNLFLYIYHSVTEVCRYLDIMTPIIISSRMQYDETLRGQNKVLAICRERQCDRYINAIGGMKLYQDFAFQKEKIELLFLKSRLREYPQLKNDFIPALSIIDVLMFNSKEQVKQMLYEYDLIKGNEYGNKASGKS